ncbi:hypothetical protein ABEI50_00205, partial [Geobacillus thermoleovorans]
GVPLLNGFLHAFIRSYTKERGNAHSSPTYSLWSLKWESPARNRMKQRSRPYCNRCFHKENRQFSMKQTTLNSFFLQHAHPRA